MSVGCRSSRCLLPFSHLLWRRCYVQQAYSRLRATRSPCWLEHFTTMCTAEPRPQIGAIVCRYSAFSLYFIRQRIHNIVGRKQITRHAESREPNHRTSTMSDATGQRRNVLEQPVQSFNRNCMVLFWVYLKSLPRELLSMI